MKWIGIVAANIALFAAIGYSVYWVALVNDRVVPSWATSQTEGATKPTPGRSSSPTYEQRRAAAACAAETSPNLSAHCIVGVSEPLRHENAPAADIAQSPTLSRPGPASKS